MRSAKPGNHLKQSGGKLGLSGTKRNKFFPSSFREFSWAVSSFLQLFIVTHVGTRDLFLAISPLVASVFDRRCMNQLRIISHPSRKEKTSGTQSTYIGHRHNTSVPLSPPPPPSHFHSFPAPPHFFVTINLSRRRGRWCHPVLMRYLWSHRRKCIRVQIYEIPAQKESNRLAPYYCHWNEYSYRFQWLTRIPLAAKNPCAALSIF